MLKFAIPLKDGKAADSLAGAREIALVTVKDRQITNYETIPTPPELVAIPGWLEGLGVTQVLAGSLGPGAQALLGRKNIEALSGVPPETPERLVEMYLNGALPHGAPPTCPSCAPG